MKARLAAFVVLASSLLLWLLPIPSERQTLPPASAVELKSISYNQFAKTLQAQRGKIVVVYYWAVYSAPDIHMLPQLLELHNKYLKAGVMAVTVSVIPSPSHYRDRVKNVLAATNAVCPNFILEDEDTAVMDKLKIEALPAIAVLNRHGRTVTLYDLALFPQEEESFFGPAERMVKRLVADRSR